MPFIRSLLTLLPLLLGTVGAHALSAESPYLETFDDGTSKGWKLNDNWRVEGTPQTGMYLASKASNATTYATYEGKAFENGFATTARIFVPSWNRQTRVGVVLGKPTDADHYEIVIDSLGTVAIERVRGDRQERVASSVVKSPLQEGRWTDVQVEYLDAKVTVRLNGVPALQEIAVDRSPTQRMHLGVLSRGASSRFDYVVATRAIADQGPDFPRLATVRIGAGPKGAARRFGNAELQDEIAKVDVALLHYDTTWQRHHGSMNDVVKQLKKRNPDIKVVLYSKANEVSFKNSSSDRSENDVFSQAHKHDWWVRDPQGQPVRSQYKDEFKLVNLTRFGKKVNGLTWPQWYARWSYEHYFEPNPLIDGLYMDNVSWQPHPTATKTADWDGDGKVDDGTREDVRSWFRQGYRDYFDEIGTLMPKGKLRFANTARWGQTTPSDNASLAEYYGVVHGGAIESLIAQGKRHAPEEWGGWQVALNYYRKVMSVLAPPKIGVVMHALTSADNYQEVRYGLATTLMDNGYYAAHVQSEGYTSTRWYDEYGVKMGRAASLPPMAMWKDGVWRRDFENAIVLVNPKGNGPRTIALEKPYRKFKGSQDPKVNDGSKVTTVTLQDRDGIVLLKE